MFSRIAFLVALIPGLLAAQAVTETVIGSAKAAATAAPAADAAGKVVGGAFNKLGQMLNGATAPEEKAVKTAPAPARSTPRPAARSAAVQHRQAPPEPPAPAVSYEDPAGIKEGMEYDEVIRRFGSPQLKFTSGPGDEVLSYSNKDQNFDVQMRNGKVTVIQKPGSDSAKQ